jgi:hypothetical protein
MASSNLGRKDIKRVRRGERILDKMNNNNLPSPAPYQDRIQVFLDLDSTIICSVTANNKFNKKEHPFNSFKMDTSFVVYERPYLQAFLDYLFKYFQVSIWTAASKDYALDIINNSIKFPSDPTRVLQTVLWDSHRDISDKLTGNSKTLELLQKRFNLPATKGLTIIIDDYDEVYDTQKHACIFAKPFDVKSPDAKSDTFLLAVVAGLERIRRCKNGQSSSSQARCVKKELVRFNKKTIKEYNL